MIEHWKYLLLNSYMKTVKVNVSFDIDVPYDDDWDDNTIIWYIEDNSCPATWNLWVELDKIINSNNWCWGCKLENLEQTVLEIKKTNIWKTEKE